MGCGENLAPILKYHCEISYGFWKGALMSRRRCGAVNVCQESYKMAPTTMASGLQILRQNLAHFCCGKFC